MTQIIYMQLPGFEGKITAAMSNANRCSYWENYKLTTVGGCFLL